MISVVNCADARLLFQDGVGLGLRGCYFNMDSGSGGLVRQK